MNATSPHCTLTLLALVLTLSMPLAAQSIFSDELYHHYTSAYDLNDARRYLDAYYFMTAVRDQMVAKMAGRSVDVLEEDDFLNYWWPVNRSVAEIAYKLGLYNVMKQTSDEMHSALARQLTTNTSSLRAHLAKIDAGYHFLTANFAAAERELRLALALASPYELSFINDLHDELAQLYYRQERYQSALEQLDSIIGFSATSHLRLADIQPTATDEVNSQRALCLARLGRYDEALQTIKPIVTTRRRAGDRRGQAEALRKQAKILMLQYDATGIYNPAAHQCYTDYMSLTRAYIDAHFVDLTEAEREQYWMAERPFVTDCYCLEDKDPALLYDVALFSKALLLQLGRQFKPSMSRAERVKALASIHVTWQQVQRCLPDTAATIEFITYERSGADHLAALVLTKKEAPRFVPIASLATLLNHRLPASGRTVGETLPRTGDVQAINALYSDTTLRRFIWNDALLNAIDGCRTLYFAPDGILHRIAIEYMLDGRRLHRLTSTRLLTSAPHKTRTDSLLMVGAIDYRNGTVASDQSPVANINDRLAYQLLAPMRPHLSALAGSRAEIDSVHQLRPQHTDRLLLADSATESTLRSLIERYHIVLLSTHGWYDAAATTGNDLRPATTDAQLSHSCLFLAGAERNLSDTTFNPGHPDGILSARELAAMDLSNVDLAVLSSCVSGLGYVTPDGVYGLQRGLKSAGVHAVIVSLWEVDDVATSLLVKYLYHNLEQGMSLHEAFHKARLQLHDAVWQRRLHRRLVSRRFDTPYHTNAFILIDGIE